MEGFFWGGNDDLSRDVFVGRNLLSETRTLSQIPPSGGCLFF